MSVPQIDCIVDNALVSAFPLLNNNNNNNNNNNTQDDVYSAIIYGASHMLLQLVHILDFSRVNLLPNNYPMYCLIV